MESTVSLPSFNPRAARHPTLHPYFPLDLTLILFDVGADLQAQRSFRSVRLKMEDSKKLPINVTIQHRMQPHDWELLES